MNALLSYHIISYIRKRKDQGITTQGNAFNPSPDSSQTSPTNAASTSASRRLIIFSPSERRSHFTHNAVPPPPVLPLGNSPGTCKLLTLTSVSCLRIGHPRPVLCAFTDPSGLVSYFVWLSPSPRPWLDLGGDSVNSVAAVSLERMERASERLILVDVIGVARMGSTGLVGATGSVGREEEVVC